MLYSLRNSSTEISNKTGSLDLVIQTEQNTTVTASIYGSDAILASGVGEGLGRDITLNVAGIDEGIYRFTVSAIDAAGNEIIRTTPAIHIDKTPPNIDYFFVDGESPVARQAEVKVTAEKGALLRILRGNEIIATGTGDGDIEVLIILPLLDAGHYWFTIQAIDAAGNVSTRDFENSLYVYNSES